LYWRGYGHIWPNKVRFNHCSAVRALFLSFSSTRPSASAHSFFPIITLALHLLRNPLHIHPLPISILPHVMSLKRAQALLVTFAVLCCLFAPHAWAAPHSIHIKRNSGGSGSRIVVRPFSLPYGSPAQCGYLFLRPRSSLLSFSSSPFPWCFFGMRFYRSSGTSLSALCWHDRTRRGPPFGILRRRILLGQLQQTKPTRRQPLAQSDARGATGALPVKFRRGRSRHI
jgi:hypothetical protein